MSTRSRKSYERLIEAVKAFPPTATSVAHPCDESSLAGAVEAAKLGIIAPILVGPQKKILAAAGGGLDAIVFTAGIGERAVAIREAVCRRAAWLGVELDPAANAGHGPRISTASSRVSAWVIPTNEELMIARHTRTLVGQR